MSIIHDPATCPSLSRRVCLKTMALSLPIVSTLPSTLYAQNKLNFLDTELPENSFYILDPIIPTGTGKKIEVIEFFWYGCQHCYALDPALNEWSKKLADDVQMLHVPAYFQDGVWKEHARLYYALDALGIEKQMRKNVFDSIHVKRISLETDAQIVSWAVQNGIDKTKIAEVLKSFGVNSQVTRAGELVKQYLIEGVPMVAVNGKFLTSPSMAKGSDKFFKVLDVLIYRERRARRASHSTAPSADDKATPKNPSKPGDRAMTKNPPK